jgi:hypothetical protein
MQIYVVGADKQKTEFDGVNDSYTIMKESGLITAFHLRCMVEKVEFDKKSKPTTLMVQSKFIAKYIDDNEIKCYDSIERCPPPMACPLNVYNCWTPIRAASGYYYTYASSSNYGSEQSTGNYRVNIVWKLHDNYY